MFEQTFKNIDNLLFKDDGCDSELDYIGQTSWVMFLRYLDELEQTKSDEAILQGTSHTPILETPFTWKVWAMPKKPDGSLDHNQAKTGQDLVNFVNLELFPYLAGFKQSADNAQTIEYKIGEIFSELKNKIASGYNLREILEYADNLNFALSQQKHELSDLYETRIKNMGNAGRNGGQYYTPRALIRAMIKVINPQIGQRVYDGAVGSAGFLCEAFDYMSKDKSTLSTSNLRTLKQHTLYGREKKNLAYVIGVMNMILHGIEAPNIIHINTLGQNITQIEDKDRYEVILANPPFGGKERAEVQHNFPIKTGETAFLFLQHFIKSLRANGKAAVVIKNTFLSNTDNAAIALRKHLLASCELHAILDMPQGTFLGAGVKTVVLFFQKGQSSKKTWIYQLNPNRKLGKTNPLNDSDMADFITLEASKANSDNSWTIHSKDLDPITYDLSIKNPNTPAAPLLKTPTEILAQMQILDEQTNKILTDIKGLL